MTKDDVKAALAAIDKKLPLLAGAELKDIASILKPGETILNAITGFYKSGTGVLLLTNNRLFFVRTKFLGGTQVEEFPFNTHNSVEYETGIMPSSHKVRIFSSSNVAEITRTGPRTQAFGEYVKEYIGKAKAAPVHAASLSMVEQLEKLAALKSSGVLNDAEFEAQKQKLLNS